VSSVELSGGAGGALGATLLDLKLAVLGLGGGDTAKGGAVKKLALSLGNSPLVPAEGQTEAETSLQSLGVVQNDIVWVTSLPVSGGGTGTCEERGGTSPRPVVEILPVSVLRASGSDASVVRVILAAAMESIGFDQVRPMHYSLSLEGEEEEDTEEETVKTLETVETVETVEVVETVEENATRDGETVVGVAVSSSVMASSCMLVGEMPSSTVARLVRFRGTSSLDDRLSLFIGVIDGFCVPLMQACCRELGVACPLETLPGLPREMIEMIVERLPGCEAPRSLGLTCKRLASIVFDPSGTLYQRVLEVRPRQGSPALLGSGPPRQGYPTPLGGGMSRHIIGGAYDMMPGGGFGGLPPRGPTRSSQRWRL